jgi:hypothetical protein
VVATLYADIREKQAELIRKALDGSAFIAPLTSTVLTTLTKYTAGPPVVIDLQALPAGYEDIGWVTADGMQSSVSSESSAITSFGSVSPTRTDVTSESSTVTVVMQETKALTIGLYTGADPAALDLAANTRELDIKKALRPTSRSYRLLRLAVDENEFGEIYIGQFFPRAKVTGRADMNMAGGDQALTWGVTFTAEEDSTAGYSERWLFGGAGWAGLEAKLGFTP